ncbi:MAG: hypothetical protein LKJ45_00390 [Oscillospiraceae bacterium]|jgi:flagellar basal-body rod modification protein FlgD|nr:hypothetical protein [Oscillospiraceae bacterium]
MDLLGITPYSGILSQAYAADSNNSSTNSAASSSNSTLDVSDFLKLMAAQMQNQSISKDSTDSSQYIQQLLDFTIIQSIQSMTKNNSREYAVSLVGHTATISKYDSAAGKYTSVQGVVKSAGFDSSGKCTISINGRNYALSDVVSVQDGAADSGSANGSGTAEDTSGSQSGA